MTWHAKSRNLLGTMRETEYRKLKQRIEAESRKKLEALELVWKMSGGSNGKAGSQSVAHLEGSTKGRLVQAIREFLQTTSGEFAISDIRTTLLRDHAELGDVRRQSIATALRRQEKRKVIEVITPGKGRTEARYRKVAAKVG